MSHRRPNDVQDFPAMLNHVAEFAPDGRRLITATAITRNHFGVSQILTARRTEPPEFAGGWELPGGKVDPGESIGGALHREILEELGATLVIGDVVPGPDLLGGWPLGDYGVMMVHLAALHPDSAQPAPIEQHDAIRWVCQDTFDDVPWLAADRAPAIAALTLFAALQQH